MPGNMITASGVAEKLLFLRFAVSDLSMDAHRSGYSNITAILEDTWNRLADAAEEIMAVVKAEDDRSQPVQPKSDAGGC